MQTRSFKLFLMVICLGGIVPACSTPERDRCSVEGTATLDGKPLSGFDIALFSEETGGGGGEVKDDGSFQIHAPIQESEYTVYFVIPAETKGEARAKLESVNLPAKYRRPETSDQKVKIVPGKNNLAIELKGN